MIDTLLAVEQLQDAGFDAKKAKALVGVIAIRTDDYPTRDDMKAGFEAVRSEIAVLRSEMTAEFRAIRSEIASEAQFVRSEFKAIRTEMRALEARLMMKLAAMQLASVGVVIAAIRFLGT
ncbi:MAG: hypothetical protein ACFB2Z_11520 [Maricaulaceae bacterium]